MPHLGVADRVKETTTTTGTGTIDLAGAPEGYQTFVAGIGNGHETYYSITNRDADEWEVGYGTISDSNPDTLSRTTVISSSNGGSLVNFSAGTKDVICTLPADRSFVIDDEANVSVTANVTATSFDGSGATLTSLNASNVSSGTLDDARLTGNVVLTSGATFTGNVSLGDGDYLNFGDSNDFYIQHSGSGTFLVDQGTGNLIIRGTDLFFQNAGGTANYLSASDGGGVNLRYNNNTKLETTTSGVTITGTVVSDGLTVESGIDNTALLGVSTDSGTEVLLADQVGGVSFKNVNGDIELRVNGAASTAASSRLAQKINDNGDISFYEDTGTTPKLFWDASAERLGIGTSSPNAPLEVSNGTENLRVSFDTGEVQLLARNASSYITQEYIANQHVFTGYGDNSSNEAMRIDSSGNVGIGTSSPSSLLHIKGANPVFRIADNNETGSGNIIFRDSVRETAKISVASGASSTYQINMLTTPAFRIDSNNDINFFEDTGTTPKLFWDASAENLGLGTTSPNGRIETTIVGSFSLGYLDYTADALFIQSNGTAGNNTYGGGISFSKIGALNRVAGISSVQTDTDPDRVGLAFFVHSSSVATNDMEEAMRITNLGRVGIGTQSPAGSLHVEGGEVFFEGTGNSKLQIKAGTSSNSFIEFGDTDDGNVGRILYAHGDNHMQFTVNASEAMRIDSSGRVGIGTGTPFFKLSLNGGMRIENLSSSPDTGSGTEYGYNTIDNEGFQITRTKGVGTSTYRPFIHRAENIQFSTGTSSTTERMRIDSSGNVGIGTSSPSTALDVSGTVTATAFSGDGSALTNVPAGVSDVNMVVITSTSTYTPTSGTQFFTVYCVGAGGGGGGGQSLDEASQAAGAGGGAGGMAIRSYNTTEMGATASVTIGSGGSGVNGTTNKANNGGNTTFNPAGTGTTLQGNGGTGGYSAREGGVHRGGANGGSGGTSSGGQTNCRGSNGQNGTCYQIGGDQTRTAAGGTGGSSLFGQGGNQQVQTVAGTQSGNNGADGSGGGGSCSVDVINGTANGGSGGNGIVVIMEYA